MSNETFIETKASTLRMYYGGNRIITTVNIETIIL